MDFAPYTYRPAEMLVSKRFGTEAISWSMFGHKRTYLGHGQSCVKYTERASGTACTVSIGSRADTAIGQ